MSDLVDGYPEDMRGEIDRLRAEIERLKEDRDYHSDWAWKWRQRVIQLEDEVKRLQAALKEVRSMAVFVADKEHGHERAFLRCQEIARRALDGEK